MRINIIDTTGRAPGVTLPQFTWDVENDSGATLTFGAKRTYKKALRMAQHAARWLRKHGRAA